MIDLGIVKPGKTIRIPINTFSSDDPQASATVTALVAADIEIYKDGSTTQRASDSGYTVTVDFDTTTGVQVVAIDLADNTTAGFYAAGSEYIVVAGPFTLDAATINAAIARFEIGYPDADLNTTIATLASQTSFTLTSGPAEDNALNGCVCRIHDVASSVQAGYAVVSDYTGSTKTVTLTSGTTFTAAASDNISFYPPVNNNWTQSTADTAQTGDGYAIVNNGTYGNAQLVRSTTPANTLNVDANNRAEALLGSTTHTGAVVPTVSTLTGHTPQTADHTANISAILNDTKMLGYMGPRGYGVYIDSNAANTNTAYGTDGTFDNAVSTLAAAKTIADSIGVNGVKRYYHLGNSDFTLAATHEDWEFVGIGEKTYNILNIGSQDVDRSKFYNLTLEGTQGGTQRIEAHRCALQDPGVGVSTFHIYAVQCGIVDDITLDASNDNVLIDTYSLVAGGGAPIIRASGASGTYVINGHKGGVDLRDLSASHALTVNIAGGQCIFDASCNVNATVQLRGIGTKTDNTGGMNNLTETAFINMDKINAEADTAISDAALATAAALTTAQNDLDIITGTDGVTLATSQPNYAPAKAGTAGSLDCVVDFIESQRGEHTWQGDIWYVAPTTGNDTTGDGSRDAPYATVTKAHTSATDNNHDIIFLLADNTGGATTHTEQVTISKNYIFIRGPGRDFQWNYNANGDVITVTGTGVELTGFTLSTHTVGSGDAINVSGDFFKARKLWIEYARQYGIYIDNADWCKIYENEIFNCGKDVESAGIYVYQSGAGTCAHNRIYLNSIDDTTGAAIETNGAVSDTVIHENNLHGSSTYGLIVGAGALTTGYHDNVFSDNASGNVSDSGTDSYFQNNEQWAKHSIATEARLAELDATNIPADIDTLLAGITVTDAGGNKIADHVLRRAFATAAASADGDTKSFRSLLGAVAKLVNKVSISGTTLTVTEADDSTSLGTQTLTTDASADPITGADTD